MAKTHPALRRALSKVAVEPNGCWFWTGALTDGGYGRFWVDGHTIVAHRWIYEQMVGEVPENHELDHLCRNRACCNPAHLEPVTHLENMRRGKAGEYWSNKTHCPRGHQYNEENTYVYGKRRFCRKCNAISAKKRRERVKSG